MDRTRQALKDMISCEFARRLSRTKNDRFFFDWAEAAFSRDMYRMFIKFMLDLGLDAEGAYELLRKDAQTMDALFEDATKEAAL
jgi:hypothetical protein